MTDKIDFKKQLDSYQAKPGEIRLVGVPELRYLMVDGHGDPNTSPEFGKAIEALFPVAYKLKFASKKELGRDYVVMPLEGLWWADDMEAFTNLRDKSHWDWTALIMVPDWIDQAFFDSAVKAVGEKNPPERLADVRLEPLDEGLSVQSLHIGPFDDEAELLHRMHHEFIPEHGLTMVGKHHEIYFSDFRKVAPEKLRTLVRQPVRYASGN